MIDIEKFMTIVRVKMLREHCFYGHILTQLSTVYSNKETSTLGVGKSSKNEITIKLYINPDYVYNIIEKTGKDEEKSIAHFIEVMKHEMHHLIFGHLSLKLPDLYRKLIACECSVNSYINRYKLVSENNEKPGVFAEDFDLDSKKSAIEYYDLLNNNKKYQKMCSNMASFAINSNSGKLQGGNNNSAQNIVSDENTGIDSHKSWESVENDDISKEMIRDIVRQAAETCKQTGKWGDVSGDLMDAINDNFAKKENIIPWEVVLKNFLASSSENVLNYSMKRKSKRYSTRPGTIKDDILNVAIGIDTSGSIDNDLLNLFFSELNWMQKSNSKMTIFEWDTKIQREYDFKFFDGNIKGRGGTDPNNVIKEISDRKFDCLIMFTDFGFSELTVEYNIPILWVVDNLFFHHIPVKNDDLIFLLNKERDGFNVFNG